jgi:tetratricopeptide (TPR) repeat protein
LERLNDERNNVRAALHWAEQTNTEAGLYLAARLRRYWESSNLREGIRWLEGFLSKSEAKNFPLARAHGLDTYGWLLTWLQQFDKALTVTEEALALFRAAGDLQSEADALISLGNIKQFLEEPDAAIRVFQQSLRIARSLNDPWREANAYLFIGWDRRDFQRSITSWEKALVLYRKAGDQIALANLLGVLGQFHMLNAEIELGEKYLDQALLIWKSNPRGDIWQNPRIAKSVVALTRGDSEQAYTLLQEAVEAAKETGNRMSYLWVRVRLGYAALRSGRLEEARSIFMETAYDFHEDGFTVGTVFTLEGIASLYVMVGKAELAARLIGYADAMREKIKDPRMPLEQADVDQTIAACLVKMGEARFSDVYDEGQTMTPEEAVTLALSSG